MISTDKRRYPRVHARNVSAHLIVADQSSPCLIQDISAGGIFIQTPEAMPVGMPVSVSLARPGWTTVLRLSGRVVWAMAVRTAAKKGGLPGMRIKFDGLSQANAMQLSTLLKNLGAADTPALLAREVEGVRRSQPVLLTDRLRRDDTTITIPGYQPSPPRPPPSGPRFSNQGVSGSDSPRLIVQVQGLLMQMGELQNQLDQREKELATLKDLLAQKEEALGQADRERRAAELAIQRLSMQLSSRR